MRVFTVAIAGLLLITSPIDVSAAAPLRDACSAELSALVADDTDGTDTGMSLALCLLAKMNGTSDDDVLVGKYYKVDPLLRTLSLEQFETALTPKATTDFSTLIDYMTKDKLAATDTPCTPIATDPPTHVPGSDHIDIDVQVTLSNPGWDMQPAKNFFYAQGIVPKAYEVKQDAFQRMVTSVPCDLGYIPEHPKHGGDNHMEVPDYLDLHPEAKFYVTDPGFTLQFKADPSDLGGLSQYQVMGVQ